LEAAQQARIAELERRFSELEAMYDKACADLMDALERASAYRATASSLHQEIERRTGVERRQRDDFPALNNRLLVSPGPIRKGPWTDRRKSWPR
jgi:chromosome segregation ATPase